jgi:hypothetical protein
MAERREFDILCLDVLDRGLGRRGVSREVFRGQLRELGIHILTTEPSDHSDDDSIEGQLMRLLKGYKAEEEEEEEEEVNDFVRRVRNARRHKALGDPEKGMPPKVIGNGVRLYGYKFVLDSKGKRSSLELNHDSVLIDRKGVTWTEVRVITFMFRCAKRRIPMARICKRLNDIGIPSPNESIGVKYTSKGVEAEKRIWQVSVMSRMLRNTSYRGRYVVNKWRTSKVPGMKSRQYVKNRPEDQIIVPIPAILDEEIQNEVIQKLQRNKKIARRNNKQPELTLLRGGLGKCGYCGRNLAPEIRYYRKDRSPVAIYRCSTDGSGTLHKCPGCYYSASELDNEVWQTALKIIQNPTIVEKAIADKKTSDPTAAKRRQIKKDITRAEDE